MMFPADAESGFGFLIENDELDRSGLTIEGWVFDRPMACSACAHQPLLQSTCFPTERSGHETARCYRIKMNENKAVRQFPGSSTVEHSAVNRRVPRPLGPMCCSQPRPMHPAFDPPPEDAEAILGT